MELRLIHAVIDAYRVAIMAGTKDSGASDSARESQIDHLTIAFIKKHFPELKIDFS